MTTTEPFTADTPIGGRIARPEGGPHGFEAWAPATEFSRRYLATAREWLGRLR